MRTTYHEQLAALSAQVGDMCGLAADAMERATEALLGADLSVAEQVIADHEHIAAISKRVEANAIKLLALQQPVAGDLRMIVGSIHIGADIDRMGALAVHVARISRLRHPECAFCNGHTNESRRPLMGGGIHGVMPRPGLEPGT